MVTFKQIEAFYWSAELGSFDRAAIQLSTTQSAISKRILELEAMLELELFDRSRRRAQLTVRGEELKPFAWEMLATRTRFMDLSRVQPVPPRNLRIGVTELTALTWLPGLVQRIRSAYPNVVIEPIVDTSAVLASKVESGDLDVVVTPDSFRDSNLEIISLDSVEYAWMCSPSYLPDVDTLPLKQLARYTVIEQSNASGLGTMMSYWLKRQHVKFERTVSSSNLTAAAALTMSGVGICYLPHGIFEDSIDTFKLKVIRSTPAIPRIPYVLMFDKSRADVFVQFVSSIATEMCDFTRASPSYF
jgi:DNA-binding transcriptional LysR family regulator